MTTLKQLNDRVFSPLDESSDSEIATKIRSVFSDKHDVTIGKPSTHTHSNYGSVRKYSVYPVIYHKEPVTHKTKYGGVRQKYQSYVHVPHGTSDVHLGLPPKYAGDIRHISTENEGIKRMGESYVVTHDPSTYQFHVHQKGKEPVESFKYTDAEDKEEARAKAVNSMNKHLSNNTNKSRMATDIEHKNTLDAISKMPEFQRMAKNLKRRDSDPEFDKEQKDKFRNKLKESKTASRARGIIASKLKTMDFLKKGIQTKKEQPASCKIPKEQERNEE